MSVDLRKWMCAVAAGCAAGAVHPQAAPAGEPMALGELTIGRLAAMQQRLLEQELVRRFSANAPEPNGPRPAAPAASAVAPALPLMPRRPRTITLLGLVAVQGAVRHAELLHEGVVIGASLGQMLSGWKLTAVTPQEVRLARGRTVVVLTPGDSLELR